MSSRRVLFGLAISAAIAWWRLPEPRPPEPGPVVRGVALGLFATDPEYDYGDMLGELRGHGATDVLVVLNWTQRDLRAHDIGPTPGWTPSDATLARTLSQADALGLRVALMPVVRLRERTPTEWRGRIQPEAGVRAWFEAYRARLLPLATLAAQHRVARLVIGSELATLTGEGARWRALALEVRARFHGRLLYSANWDHFDEIPFWDAVDEVGVTGYFTLAGGPDPSLPALVRSWARHRAQLAALRARVGKPVLITEVGYAPHPAAATRPWDEAPPPEGDAPALALQARLYDAFCQAFAHHPTVDGFYFWNWFGWGGPLDWGYTPRGKPAAARMAACLRSRWVLPGGR